MIEPVIDGPIFTNFKSVQQGYTQKTEDCSVRTVRRLLNQPTDSSRPGMLLGKVQSGKTRAFLGVIAIAFDSGYDGGIAFTKGTRALTQQTVARLNSDFRRSIENELVLVYDIKTMPDNLSNWELGRKLVIVCKKEDDNLCKLTTTLLDAYRELSERRLLIIDDEADFASIGYRRGQDGIEANVIPSQMDYLRQSLRQVSFLQVTATPYSLYLQPENIEIPATQERFKPVRPAFTELVPIYDGYIGDERHFAESQNPDTIASLLHVPIRPSELIVLRQANSRSFRQEEWLTSPEIESIRRSLVTFIVGSWIRRWQEQRNGNPRRRYSFIVHTEVKRSAHEWQATIVSMIKNSLQEAIQNNETLVNSLITSAYDDLKQSLQLPEFPIPSVEDTVGGFGEALEAVVVTKVNSEPEVDSLLDASGQLELRTPYNIFIGGQILDRGLTIENLIGFFYGRSPKRAQQDTVLQHCRIYGNRPLEDLAVTRFYTTPQTYNIMSMIHEFGSALREAFERGGENTDVVFLRNDPQRRVIVCNPNKILLSSITALRASKRLIPVGFSTTPTAARNTQRIDDLLLQYREDPSDPIFVLPLEVANSIVDVIANSLKMDDGSSFDFTGLKAAMQYLSDKNPNEGRCGEVVCLVRRDRNDSKIRRSGRLQNAPESSGDDQLIARRAEGRPALLLYRENGARTNGWSDFPFYWPVLQAPPNTVPVIYASKASD